MTASPPSELAAVEPVDVARRFGGIARLYGEGGAAATACPEVCRAFGVLLEGELRAELGVP
ncbi:MAG: hypothetical protein ACK4N5_24780 [Myxococcales bacterium]